MYTFPTLSPAPGFTEEAPTGEVNCCAQATSGPGGGGVWLNTEPHDTTKKRKIPSANETSPFILPGAHSLTMRVRQQQSCPKHASGPRFAHSKPQATSGRTDKVPILLMALWAEQPGSQ